MLNVAIVSVAVVLCFTVTNIYPTKAESSVNCTQYSKDNTSCCAQEDCFFLNCTEKANVSVIHRGCHNKVNRTTVIKGVCKEGLEKAFCEGPDKVPTCSQFKNKTSCCVDVHVGCLWTEDCYKGSTSVPKGCFNASVISGQCDSFTNKCEGTVATTCESFKNQTACCNNTDLSCMFYSCKDKSDPTKNVSGCHNSTETTVLNATCAPHTASETCAAPKPTPAKQCTNYTDLQTCCKQADLACVYVNCTGSDKKQYTGCYNQTQPKCPRMVDQCGKTTVAPKTTPSTTTQSPVTPNPQPTWKACETYKNMTDCCSSGIYKCIYINCTTAITGCYSSSNKSDIQIECGAAPYYDACEAHVPVTTIPPPPTTTASGRHFDGASFIGGIVLCAGIIIIIVFAVKFYRSRQASNNYHQM